MLNPVYGDNVGAGIKEMDSKVQELAKENKSLKARVEALEKKVLGAGK